MRVWILYSTSTILRLWNLANQKGVWFEDQPKCSDEVKSDCLGRHNEELIDPVRANVRKAIGVLVILSATICIICCEKRSFASAFMVIECLIQICVVFLPNTNN